VGEALAREALAAAIRQACAIANIPPSQIKRTCAGLAGAARPEVSDPVERFIAELVPGEIEVVGDIVITLEAAFGSEPGVIVIAGTGSIAYGRNARGKTARAGGWGFAISDEGSGHWIGRTAVAAAIRAVDQAPAQSQVASATPPLLASLLNGWRVHNREQLLLAANATPPPDFATLVPAVLASADHGDPVALDILHQAGAELASLAATVITRLFADSGILSVAMSGGVFSSSEVVRQVFYNRLWGEYPGVVLNPGVIEPVRGALELARKGAAK
jgi:N-acetylglucosamine kinase-like BadF-type ATPase